MTKTLGVKQEENEEGNEEEQKSKKKHKWSKKRNNKANGEQYYLQMLVQWRYLYFLFLARQTKRFFFCFEEEKKNSKSEVDCLYYDCFVWHLYRDRLPLKAHLSPFLFFFLAFGCLQVLREKRRTITSPISPNVVACVDARWRLFAKRCTCVSCRQTLIFLFLCSAAENDKDERQMRWWLGVWAACVETVVSKPLRKQKYWKKEKTGK